MERRGRIPVAKFRTQEGKTRSRSRVREPDYNEQDPETDLFVLLEDNIALKEENKTLKTEIEEHKKSETDLLDEKIKIRSDLEKLKRQQSVYEGQIEEMKAKYAKVNGERNTLDELHKVKMEEIESLTKELHLLQDQKECTKSPDVFYLSPKLNSKLRELLPILANKSNRAMESKIELDPSAPITNEVMESLVLEFANAAQSLNSVELQLYETHEKIAELLENQHHLEEENETLRTENTNLTKVAKLLTENMKESVETSKKMEAALIKLKQRNDELIAKNRDLTDGQPGPSPSPTTIKANEEFEKMKEEVESQNRDHGERIVEMVLTL